MQLLDPRPQQEEQRRTVTAQSQHFADELAKMLMEHGQNAAGQMFTSPWQAAGQVANALAGRNAMGNNAANQYSLNSLLAPGGGGGPAAAEATTAAAAPPGGSAPGGAKAAPFDPAIKQAIIEGSKAAGFPAPIMAQFAHIESGGRAGPEADTGHYKGLMQLSEDEMARESGGQGNVYNPKDSTMAAAQIAKRNYADFKAKFNKEPTAFDLYMMHQQGPAGYEAHLRNPNQPAWQSMLSTGEGQSKGEQWAKAAITGNMGHINDTSQQFLQRWSDKWQRAAAGDHGAFTSEQPQGQQVAQAAPAPTAGTPGGNLVEHGHFVDSAMLQRRPPPTYTLPQLQALAKSGQLAPEQIQKFYAELTAAQQPMEQPFAGGKVIFDPKNPGQQTYIPTLQTKPMKVGDIETQQSFWVDSKGQQHTMAEHPAAGGAVAAPAPPQSGATAAPAAGSGDPFPAGGSMTDIANWGERRKVRIAGEEETEKTRAAATTKTFNGIYAGIAGSGDNAAHQAQNIALLKEVAPAAFTGAGSEALLGLNRLAARLGIDPKGAAPREVFNMMASRVLNDQFAGMRNLSAEEGSQLGRLFQSMLETEKKATITNEDTLDGVMAKLNLFEQSGKQMMRWADMADDHVAKHGALDPSFMKKLRKDIAESRFEDVLPTHGAPAAATGGGGGTAAAPGGGNAAPVQVKTPADAQNLAPGTLYVRPDGKVMRR